VNWISATFVSSCADGGANKNGIERHLQAVLTKLDMRENSA